MSGKLPVLSAVSYSYAFIRTAIMPAFPAYVLFAISMGAVSYASVMIQSGGNFGVYVAFAIISLVTGIAALGMALRLALYGTQDGLFGLKLGPDEGRLLMASLAFWAMLGLISIIGGFILAVFFAFSMMAVVDDPEALQDNPEAVMDALAGAMASPVGWITILATLAFVVLLLWLWARLITFPAATVDRDKVMIFETWSWTDGNGWRTLAAALLTLAPLYVVSFVATQVIAAGFGVSMMSLMVDPAAATGTSAITMAVISTLSSLTAIPYYLASAALSVFLYKGFNPKGTQTVAKTFD